MITIDPAPYAAEVKRAEAQVAAARAHLSLARPSIHEGDVVICGQMPARLVLGPTQPA